MSNSKTWPQLPADYDYCPIHQQPLDLDGRCPDCEQETERRRRIWRSEIDYDGYSNESVENVDDIDNLYDNPLFP